MCWGVKEVFVCEICSAETSSEINWQGCQNEVCEIDTPICPDPIISNLSTTHYCQACQTEADDGGDANDIYPEPYDHPGFSDPKPVVNVQRVEYPEPTAYESCSNIENLPGAADELPSYEDAMNELPAPPSYNLLELRDQDYDGTSIPNIAFYRATRRHRALTLIAHDYRRHINAHLIQNPPLAAIRILDLATETIERFLFEQEQLLSRINLLRRHLDNLNAEIAALPNPHPELALLEQRRDSVVRELEGYAEHQGPTAEQWGARLESLLCEVRRENQAARMEDLRDTFNGCR